ncbi:MAG: hypothetical protein JWN72_809 [Thermoleophilia bacterium]|nr:hypothetical protein [Thermoleophilia bacterium]
MRLAPTSARALTRIGHADGAKVTARELATTRAAIAALPAADRALLVRHGLHVELVPKQSLGQGMLGATLITRDAGDRLTPTSIRVASRATGKGPEALREVVQHEIGHAISVLRKQDRSEDAAAQYALDH